LAVMPTDLLGGPPLGSAGGGELEMPGTAWDGSQWEEGDGQVNERSAAGSASEETAREPRLMARGAWGMSGAWTRGQQGTTAVPSGQS